MTDRSDILDRLATAFPAPEPSFERFTRRRKRKQTWQRLAAGTLAVCLSLGPIGWAVHAFHSGPNTQPQPQPIGNPGELEWSTTFATQDAPGVAVDATGTYVIRTGEGSGEYGPRYPTYLLAKYGLDGVVQWTRQFGDKDDLSAVSIGPAGIYVAGSAGYSTFIREFSSDGDLIRTTWFPVGLHRDVLLTIDPTGFYVAGYGEPERSGETIQGAFVRKFSLDGNSVLWTRLLGTDSYPTGIASSATGLYLVGAPTRSNGSLLERLDPRSGAVSWVKRWDEVVSTASTSTTVASFGSLQVAADPTGVYVTGVAPDQTTSINKYDPAGNELWSSAFGSGSGPHAITADPRGVYVTSIDSSSSSLAASAYDRDGVLLWTRTIAFRAKPKSHLSAAIAVGPSSASIVAQSIPFYPQCVRSCPNFTKQYFGRGGLTSISLGSPVPATTPSRDGSSPPYAPIAIVVLLALVVWLATQRRRARGRST